MENYKQLKNEIKYHYKDDIYTIAVEEAVNIFCTVRAKWCFDDLE